MREMFFKTTSVTPLLIPFSQYSSENILMKDIFFSNRRPIHCYFMSLHPINNFNDIFIINYMFIVGEARPGYWFEVSDQRWSAQLEQGVHKDQGAEDGEGDRLLLRQLRTRKNSQAQV